MLEEQVSTREIKRAASVVATALQKARMTGATHDATREAFAVIAAALNELGVLRQQVAHRVDTGFVRGGAKPAPAVVNGDSSVPPA